MIWIGIPSHTSRACGEAIAEVGNLALIFNSCSYLSFLRIKFMVLGDEELKGSAEANSERNPQRFELRKNWTESDLAASSLANWRRGLVHWRRALANWRRVFAYWRRALANWWRALANWRRTLANWRRALARKSSYFDKIAQLSVA